MKIVEAILSALVIIGITFKVLHYPGAGPILVLSLSLLSLTYFVLGFFIFSNLSFAELGKVGTFKKISTFRMVGAAGTGLALSMGSIAVLFKLQSYPGATPQMMIGAFSLGVVLLISGVKWLRTKDSFYSNILKRVVLYFSVLVFLLMIPNQTWLAWQYPNNPEYVNALMKAQADPGNELLWEAVEVERTKMYEQELAIPEQTED